MVYNHFDIFLNQQFHFFLYYMYILRVYKNVRDQILIFLHCLQVLQYVHNETLVKSIQKKTNDSLFIRKKNILFHLLQVIVKHSDSFVPFQLFHLQLLVFLIILNKKKIILLKIDNYAFSLR